MITLLDAQPRRIDSKCGYFQNSHKIRKVHPFILNVLLFFLKFKIVTKHLSALSTADKVGWLAHKPILYTRAGLIKTLCGFVLNTRKIANVRVAGSWNFLCCTRGFPAVKWSFLYWPSPLLFKLMILEIALFPRSNTTQSPSLSSVVSKQPPNIS